VPGSDDAFPTLGSIVAHELGDLEHDLPAFVQINGPAPPSDYLGVESAPLVVEDPTSRIANLSYGTGVDSDRLDHRERMRAVLDREFARQGGAPAIATNDARRLRARRLMDSKLAVAFDLAQEKDAVRDAYGRGRFGQSVLLARRLLDHGVSAVEVVLDGWDTHHDNFNRTRKLCEEFDPAFAALLDDLAARGGLDDTLVLCMGEFGRTPSIVYGDGRGHWPACYCAVLAGGGVRSGTVVGETDEQGREIVRRPVQVADLFATVARLLGIEGGKEFTTNSRSIRLVDPKGIVVRELLASP
jgi:hypothetical protein